MTSLLPWNCSILVLDAGSIGSAMDNKFWYIYFQVLPVMIMVPIQVDCKGFQDIHGIVDTTEQKYEQLLHN